MTSDLLAWLFAGAVLCMLCSIVGHFYAANRPARRVERSRVHQIVNGGRGSNIVQISNGGGNVVQVANGSDNVVQIVNSGGGTFNVVTGGGATSTTKAFKTGVTKDGRRFTLTYDANGDQVVTWSGGTTPAPLPTVPVDDYCAGCDRLMPSSSMAFDEDGDDYRCRQCRGLPEHTTLQERLEQRAAAAAADPVSAAVNLPIIASVPTEAARQGYTAEDLVEPADRHATSLELAQKRWLARQRSSEQSDKVLPPRGPYPVIEADIDDQQRCGCGPCRSGRVQSTRRVFDHQGRQTEVLPGSLVGQVLWPTEPTPDTLRWEAVGDTDRHGVFCDCAACTARWGVGG